jgi:hypothetical protein
MKAPNSLLKKPSMAFSTAYFERRSGASLRAATFGLPVRQRGFRNTPIFNGLQPSKMAVRPCTANRSPKNSVFQQAASLAACIPCPSFVSDLIVM